MTKPRYLSPRRRKNSMSRKSFQPAAMQLYDVRSRRLYINFHERVRFAHAARTQDAELRCFCAVLLHTGCRLSEAIHLTSADIQVDQQLISFKTLKQRGKIKVREVPIPKLLAQDLARTFKLADQGRSRLLWQYKGKAINRSRGYRWVKAMMAKAGIEGEMACPKGLRHGFGVHAIRVGVPLNLLQKWMGHATIEVTAIYADAIGKEEREIAARMWAEKPALITGRV